MYFKGFIALPTLQARTERSLMQEVCIFKLRVCANLIKFVKAVTVVYENGLLSKKKTFEKLKEVGENHRSFGFSDYMWAINLPAESRKNAQRSGKDITLEEMEHQLVERKMSVTTPSMFGMGVLKHNV